MITEIIISASIKATQVMVKAVPFAQLSKEEQRELKLVKQEKHILAYCQ